MTAPAPLNPWPGSVKIAATEQLLRLLARMARTGGAAGGAALQRERDGLLRRCLAFFSAAGGRWSSDIAGVRIGGIDAGANP